MKKFSSIKIKMFIKILMKELNFVFVAGKKCLKYVMKKIKNYLNQILVIIILDGFV